MHKMESPAGRLQLVPAATSCGKCRPLTRHAVMGRTALHRAFYWGHFRCAALLLAANAHLSLTDHKVKKIQQTCITCIFPKSW